VLQCRLDPSRTVVVHDIGGEHCLVVDNLFEQPQQWITYASDHVDGFTSPGNDGYPGVQLTLSPDLIAPLLAEFRSVWRRPLSMGRPVPLVDARLAMVTLTPQQLRGMQQACHVDGPYQPPDAVVAGIVYLFRDPSLGGTAFYRQVEVDGMKPGSASWLRAMRDYFAEPRGYMGAANPFFEQVMAVEAVYNRLVLYPGHVFHSGMIRHPERLSGDPAVGRLTMNIFMKCFRV
jgi:hypothetical protein